MNTMIKHHPDDNLLTEFSAGTLAFGQSIAVSAHLHYCSRCRARVASLNTLGADLLQHGEPEAVSDSLLASVMDQLDQSPTPAPAPKAPAPAQKPRVLEKILSASGPEKWEFLTPSLHMARLKTGQQEFEVSLHRIKAGGSVAEHDHKGTEITLVLEGSFSDEAGIYNEGDFLLREAGQVHRPLASRDAPCICLSVVAAPVKMTGTFARLLNPFLSFRPQ
ncbi:ChrR family anti-sigma-E factor [Simiduia agarivorans]|uniref:Anti-sigm factor, ChrR n=1 Tax=Simiduia agarivorans (strain DSM 21679 / JCM 13881 / BCRC 17597 / SA1) TaxID=1117647 RepID=K4KID0_SIMAS|nr:ChrR family anti-sigma-E factor [Simiduia agarivorans]AFU98781.1 anti-sigm factor, ChrR [Simiduia agarivorans SA1 = DSM 21679]